MRVFPIISLLLLVLLAGCGAQRGGPNGISGNRGGKTKYQNIQTVVDSLSFTQYSEVAPTEIRIHREGEDVFYTVEEYKKDPIDYPIDPAYLEELASWVDQYEIRKWDGFDRVDHDVLDGGGFSLKVTLGTEETIFAHGSNAYPDNYPEARKALRDILDCAEVEALGLE